MEAFGSKSDDRKSVINPNARPSYLDNGNPPTPDEFEFDFRIRKKLSEEFEESENEADGDNIKTYLRLRPPSRTAMAPPKVKGADEVFTVQDDKTLLVKPIKKLFGNNTIMDCSETTFTYSRVFDRDTQQITVYEECVRGIVNGFLDGNNGLIFSYGATNSGKTYTMQGYGKDFGIIPRTLEQLFSRVEDCLYKKGDIKPHQSDSYIILDRNGQRINAETRARVLRDAKIKPSDMSSFVDSILRSSSSSLCSSLGQAPGVPVFATLSSVGTDDEASLASLPDKSTLYSIWVSFAEIYNERVYDLFDTVIRSGKSRRRELKILQDKQGHVYIKELTECCVNTAEEAYQFFLAGKQNLQFASTNVNSNSSRSHSFFNIRMVVIGKIGNHLYAKEVRRFSFCDLAGLERMSQTGNAGARLKESGTINQSLLVLLRCIRALRDRQKGGKADMIPYRDSKLTRLFQSYLSTATQISMIVNINPDPEMIDSSIQVIQNSAIASTIRTFKKIEPPCNDSHFFRKVRMSIRLAREIEEESEDEDTPEVVTAKKRKPNLTDLEHVETHLKEDERSSKSQAWLTRRLKTSEDETREKMQQQYDLLLLGQRQHYEKLLKREREHAAVATQQRVNLAVAAVRDGLFKDTSEDSEEGSEEETSNEENNGPISTVRRHTLAVNTPMRQISNQVPRVLDTPDKEMSKQYELLLQENKNLKEELAEMVATVHAVSDAKAEKARQIKTIMAENQALKTQVAGFKLEMKEQNDLMIIKDRKIVNLQETISSNIQSQESVKESDGLRSKITQMEEKIKEMEQDLKDGEQTCIDYDSKLADANARSETLTAEINTLNHQFTLLIQEKDMLHLVIDEKDAKIQKLKNDMSNSKTPKSPVFCKPHPVYGSPLHSPGATPSPILLSQRPRRVTAKYSMNGPTSSAKK